MEAEDGALLKKRSLLYALDCEQRTKRRMIHHQLFSPFFGANLLHSFLKQQRFQGKQNSHYFRFPHFSRNVGRIVLFSPTCVVTNVHLSHKKKDASTVRYRPDTFTYNGVLVPGKPSQSNSSSSSAACDEEILPPFATEEADCTMYIVGANEISSELFHQMPFIVAELEELVEKMQRPDIFSKTFVCWNKKRCEQMIVFDSKNVVNYQVNVPVPRKLFVPPPDAIMKAISESVFGGLSVYPPLLHWSVYAMKEGKLFGLNFDWHECYMTPSALPGVSKGGTVGASGSLPDVVDDEDDDVIDDDNDDDSSNVENQQQQQAQEFRKLTDAKYAVVMMMSNYRRVVKFYFHPSLVPATADPTRKKRICSTIRFELNNGQCLVIPQETKVCVTASQVSNEIFSGKKQKKDFAKTFYFCVLFFGPRFQREEVEEEDSDSDSQQEDDDEHDDESQ